MQYDLSAFVDDIEVGFKHRELRNNSNSSFKHLTTQIGTCMSHGPPGEGRGGGGAPMRGDKGSF